MQETRKLDSEQTHAELSGTAFEVISGNDVEI
jgi:hypothetical protein